MRAAPLRADEEARLRALDEYDALHSDLDPRLDEIVGLAKEIFEVPIALVSLVERERQIFAARIGIDACETARDISFCSHALGRDELLIVPDARLDPRFADNPLVTGAPFIRFYAGAPLRSSSGHDLGTLCIVDRTARKGLSARDRKSLRDLAALVVDQLEMRRLDLASKTNQRRFQNIAATSPDAIVCADHDGRITFWNATATMLFGYSEAEALGANIDIIVPAAQRGGHGDGLQRVARGGAPRLVGKTVELDARDRDGIVIPIELSLSMWHEDGRTSFGAIMRDITERRRTQDNLYRLAHQDWLTALPNRGVLLERISEASTRGEPFSLLLIDIDDFKDINDAVGHGGGDAVLKQLSRRLLDSIAGVDTLARLGGDEFAILIPAGSPSSPEQVADLAIAVARAPFAIDGGEARIDASVGIARHGGGGSPVEALLSNAGLALSQAKAEGRGCWRVFSPQLREAALRRHAFEDELRSACERGEFVLFYQPQVDLADGGLTGAEALLRWQHPRRGLMSPAEFLPALEQGLVAHDVGAWVMETACAQAAVWRDRIPGFRMGVNLFGVQFRDGQLCRRVHEVLRRSGLPPSALELEVTENIILRQDATMLDALRELHELGVAVAFDDFGTGFASLSMLKAYPLSRLKIDRSFVTNVTEDTVDALIVSAVAMLGRGLGLDVIAEGVETAQQRDMLRLRGCSSGQGYLFGKPMPAAEFERLLPAQAAQPFARVAQA